MDKYGLEIEFAELFYCSGKRNASRNKTSLIEQECNRFSKFSDVVFVAS